MQTKNLWIFLAVLLAALTLPAIAAEEAADAASAVEVVAVETVEVADEATSEQVAEAPAAVKLFTTVIEEITPPTTANSCSSGSPCWSHNDCGGTSNGWCLKFEKVCWCF